MDTEISKMRRIVCCVHKYWDGQRSMRLESLYQGENNLSTVSKCQRASLIRHLVRHSPVFCNIMSWCDDDSSKNRSVSELCAEDLNLSTAEILYYPVSRTSWAKKVDQLRDRLEPRPSYTQFNKSGWETKISAITNTKVSQFVEEGPKPYARRQGELREILLPLYRRLIRRARFRARFVARFHARYRFR